MKYFLLLVLSIGIISGCETSTSPTTSTISATSLPQDSTYLFDCVSASGHVEVDTIRIARLSDSSFLERYACTVDTVRDSVVFTLRDGDLVRHQAPLYDLVLGVGSHRRYEIPTLHTPVRYQGYAYEGSIDFFTEYLGEESVRIGSRSYQTSEVRESVIITFVPDIAGDTLTSKLLTTYWYSSALGFAVKEQEESFYSPDIPDAPEGFVRTLRP
jgi:hypothetical protein